MNIRPDDPRITAYHLGELTRQEALAVEHAAASDPAVRLALREMGNLTGFLQDTLGPAREVGLRPAQREAIRRAGRDTDPAGRVVELPSARRPLRSWLTGLGAAAGVAFAAVLLNRLADAPPPVGQEVSRKVALLPQPGPEVGTTGTGAAAGGGGGSLLATNQTSAADGVHHVTILQELQQGPLPDVDELPETADQASFSHSPELRLPVVIGTASGAWVRRWISEKNQLPPARAVRVEEMVNRVTLPTDRRIEGLKVGVHRLDWGGSRWIAVQLAAGERDVTGLAAHSEAGAARRVVGSFGRQTGTSLPSTLAAGRATLVLLEFEDGDAEPGNLVIGHDGGQGVIEVGSAARVGEPGMRHTLALAVFGRWLRGEAGLDSLREALALAGRGEADPVHLEDQRIMRRAIELAANGR